MRRARPDTAARNHCPFIGIAAKIDNGMARFRKIIPVDDYVLDVLMRDLVGHDQQPAAYLVYLRLYSVAVRNNWKAVSVSLRALAEETGLSKSAVQTALATLRRRELINIQREHATAIARHRVLRHWRR